MIEHEVYDITISPNSWYFDLKYYLTHGVSPDNLEPKKNKNIKIDIFTISTN